MTGGKSLKLLAAVGRDLTVSKLAKAVDCSLGGILLVSQHHSTEQNTPTFMYDVVVVGAGFSGLMAAKVLEENGASVCVLEAKDRVGGRTLSQKFAGGVIDLGGQWVGPGQQRMYALCETHGVETFPTYHSGKHILELGGKTSVYSGSIPRISPLALIELQRTIMRVEKAVSQTSAVDAFTTERGQALDQLTVGEWARRHVWGEKVRSVLNAAVRVIFGADMSEISMLHFLMYCNAGGGLMRLCEIENAAQQDRIVGGAQGLAIKMAADLKSPPLLSHAVRAIGREPHQVSVSTAEGDITARAVILAVPPPVIESIEFQPRLPLHRELLQKRMPMGATIKCMAAYKVPFWRENNFSGEVVADGQPLTVAFDNTTHEGVPVLLGFIVGQPARQWGPKSADERRVAVLESFARWFGPEALEPLDYVEKDWSIEPFTGGCPIAVPAPGMWHIHGHALRTPIGRIFWAGTETATESMGFMEGALQSGERAAKEVLETYL